MNGLFPQDSLTVLVRSASFSSKLSFAFCSSSPPPSLLSSFPLTSSPSVPSSLAVCLAPGILPSSSYYFSIPSSSTSTSNASSSSLLLLFLLPFLVPYRCSVFPFLIFVSHLFLGSFLLLSARSPFPLPPSLSSFLGHCSTKREEEEEKKGVEKEEGKS